MSEGALIATIGTIGTVICALIAAYVGRGRPGVTVTAAASQSSVQSTNNAVAELAKTVAEQGQRLSANALEITALGNRVDDLEDRERSYLRRIDELERWGATALGPPPRPIPPWLDRPV